MPTSLGIADVTDKHRSKTLMRLKFGGSALIQYNKQSNEDIFGFKQRSLRKNSIKGIQVRKYMEKWNTSFN